MTGKHLHGQRVRFLDLCSAPQGAGLLRHFCASCRSVRTRRGTPATAGAVICTPYVGAGPVTVTEL